MTDIKVTSSELIQIVKDVFKELYEKPLNDAVGDLFTEDDKDSFLALLDKAAIEIMGRAVK